MLQDTSLTCFHPDTHYLKITYPVSPEIRGWFYVPARESSHLGKIANRNESLSHKVR